MKNLLAYTFLIAGITFGVVANGYFLKVSEGFTKFLPSIFGVLFILLAYFSLAKAMQTIPIGFTYATYGGITTIGVVLLGFFKFNQVPNMYSVVGIVLILIGVFMVNYLGSLNN